MNLKQLLATSALLTTITATAQELNHETINNSRIRRPVVKLELAHILSASEALLPVGVEYRFNKWLGAFAEIGIPLMFSADPGTYNIKTLRTDIRYKGGTRFYINTSSKHLFFISLEASLRKQTYSIEKGTFILGGYQADFSYADIDKTITVVDIVGGKQFNMSKRLFAEILVGFGYKDIKINRSNIVNLQKTQNEVYKAGFFIPMGAREDEIENHGGIINFAYSLKLCFRI